ncbi:MAG: TauD/TfdA family dioxygenase [Pseudomonadota bacterium]
MGQGRQLTVRPLSGGIGAEVRGIDLAGDLSEAAWSQLHDAFLDYLVLAIVDQSLSPAAQLALGERFGSPFVHPFRPSLPGFPQIIPLVKEAEERRNVGGVWHTDLTCLPTPPLGTLLYAKEVPTSGGDTMFSNGYLAYEGLSAPLRETLEGLRAVHSAVRAHGPRATTGQGAFREKASQKAEATQETIQPVVRTHPETGRKALFVNRVFTLRFDGWTAGESAPLLRYLYDHMTQPEYVCRIRWREGTLVLWDNRCTQHYALNDYHGQRRVMHRLMIEGDRPYL